MSKTTADLILDACEVCWQQFCNDCSGFAKAVARQCGVLLVGQANDITDYLGNLAVRVQSAAQAKWYAQQGYFVLAGLKGAGNGHVVVVVHDPTNHGAYPTAYWGRLHNFKAPDGKVYNFGIGRKFEPLNYAWKHPQLANVVYGAVLPTRLLMNG